MARITHGWPVIVLLLDGLADWPCRSLDGQTPLEFAQTPHLDRLAAEGANGLLYPLGPGRCPSSERAQWSYLGYSPAAFPGRASLEALGAGIEVPTDGVVAYLALRSVRREGTSLVLQNWYREVEDGHCRSLLAAIDGMSVEGFTFRVVYLERGDAICFLEGPADPGVTDSDPFSTTGPVLSVEACTEAEDIRAAAATAQAMTKYLTRCHEVLERHPVNAARRRQGFLPLNAVVTKWTGSRAPLLTLDHHVGGSSTFVSSRRLYAGIARAVGARFEPVPESDPAEEVARKLDVALARVEAGDALVYVHTKAPDEAGHRHDPEHKQDVISQIDRSLAPLTDRPDVVVAVTADHATPSWGPLLHSGDAVPLVVRAPSARVDDVKVFSERAVVGGSLGTLQGADFLPLVINAAGRARFLGSRHGATAAIAAPIELPALVADFEVAP